MKIGLVGAACTGKTTLAKAVGEKLGIPVIGENFDNALKRIRHTKGPTESFPEYFQRVWKVQGYHQEIIDFGKALADDLDEQEEKAGNDFITDSASPAQAAAMLMYGMFIQDEFQLKHWVDDRLFRSRSYAHLFYLPVNIQMVDDSRRVVNKNQQAAFDYILDGLYNHLPVAVLPKQDYVFQYTLENRILYVMKRITK